MVIHRLTGDGPKNILAAPFMDSWQKESSQHTLSITSKKIWFIKEKIYEHWLNHIVQINDFIYAEQSEFSIIKHTAFIFHVR